MLRGENLHQIKYLINNFCEHLLFTLIIMNKMHCWLNAANLWDKFRLGDSVNSRCYKVLYLTVCLNVFIAFTCRRNFKYYNPFLLHYLNSRNKLQNITPCHFLIVLFLKCECLYIVCYLVSGSLISFKVKVYWSY